MKKLLLLSLAMLTLYSCSSSQVNNAKIGAAKMLGDGASSFMDKQYQKMGPSVYGDMSCAAEATKVGDAVKLFVEDKLKVNHGVMSLSVGGEVAEIACGLVASKLLPDIILKNISDYPCFAKMASDQAQGYIEKELCNSIEF